MSRSSEVRTVAVVSSGDGTGLNFCRALADAGGYRTVGIDLTLEDFHTSEADVRYLVPWESADAFVDSVNEILAKEDAVLVYAADTGRELEALAANRERLGARTLLPDHASLARMEDKWATHQALSAAGIPVPHTVLVRSPDDLVEILREHPRIWLRRTAGSGGAGSLATGSTALASSWVEEHQGWGQFTAAECLSTDTLTLSAVWNEGALVCSQLRERVSWKYPSSTPSGVTGITGTQRTIWDPEVHEMALRCVRAVCPEPHGVIGVDFTRTADGVPLPTEVQPARFYTSILFLARLGLNMPDLYCRIALGEDASGWDPIVNPIRDTRYWVKAVDREPLLLNPQEFAVA